MKLEEILKLHKEFSKLDEFDKWSWILNHQSTEITIMLDNDSTYGVIESDEEDEDENVCFDFDWYLGDSDGVSALLSALGIRFKYV